MPRHTLLAIGLGLCCSMSWARGAPPYSLSAPEDAGDRDGAVPTKTPPVKPKELPAETVAPYEDRLIEGGRLSPLAPEDGEAVTNTQGIPRSWRWEAGSGASQRGDAQSQETGIAIGAFWETPNWGAWSLEASLRRESGDRIRGGPAGRLTVWQRQVPFQDGWRADHGVGVLNTPVLPLLRQQSRFAVPTVPMVGVVADWRRPSLQVQAAVGEPGLLGGGRWSGFEATGGTVLAAGAQMSWAPPWQAALAFLGVDRALPAFLPLRAEDQPDRSAPRVDTRGLHAAVSWTGTTTEVQGNLLGSQASGVSWQGGAADAHGGTAWGAWADATTKQGAATHRYGVFRLDPGLMWGINPISSDVEGAYYRLDHRRSRWTWNAGVDHVQSVSGLGTQGQYANAGVRHQTTASLGLGGSMTVRTGDGTAQVIQAYADKRTRWGSTRLQLNAAQDAQGHQARQLTVDHALPGRSSTHWSGAVSVAEMEGDVGTTRSTSLALYGGGDLGHGLSLEGNVRWTRGQGPEAEEGFEGTLGASWQMGSSWSLAATYQRSQGQRRSPFVIDPLNTPWIPNPTDRSWFLTLRHERHSGMAEAVLGGIPGMGSGAIEGSVFFDDNDDGQRNAGEQAVPDLTVLLDGRFSIRTDAQGRFSFPAVAIGPHRITVEPDNLPLPWVLRSNDMAQEVRVDVRATVRLDIRAQRPR